MQIHEVQISIDNVNLEARFSKPSTFSFCKSVLTFNF